MLNKQLEASQLARELSQFYHEMNRFHYCSLTINNTIPFRFTLPSRHKPKSTIQFYTSKEAITKETIELYNSILLFYPPHFYTQAAKERERSFLAKFVALASPFLSFEAMSVQLDVPIEKIFEVALNLQEANMATIIICITHRTCFTVFSFLASPRAGRARPLHRAPFSTKQRVQSALRRARLPPPHSRSLQQRAQLESGVSALQTRLLAVHLRLGRGIADL